MTTGLAKDEPQIVAVKEDAAPAVAAGGDHGKTLYSQYCSACHGAAGEGVVGPALKNESAKKSRDEVAAFIKDPKAPMPKLWPTPLSDQDVGDVAAYVETLK
jgi:ubiquinol-cytochrome c reductase cytochrome c subunit